MLWKRLSIAMLCCWCMSAWAANPWCSPAGTSALTFEWVPKDKAEPSIGSVRIRDASGKIVQVLDNLTNEYGNSESLRSDRDFNRDGCPDLIVTADMAAIGNESVDAFLYDSRKKRFILHKGLSALGGLDLDPENQNCVTSTWKGGAADIYWAQHCWNKGKLVIQREYDVSPMYNTEGEFQCYQHIATDYRGGKKRERTDCINTL